MKTAAILGPTASGKTDLALTIARRHDCAVLSLDSLALYRRIDIASAKPTLSERAGVAHFGIDEIDPDEPFSVALFARLFERARDFCERYDKNLLIVGGTGFYLKALIEGLSDIPEPSPEAKAEVLALLRSLPDAYAELCRVDSKTAERISPTDRYRIEKALMLHRATGLPPSHYFALHPPKPLAAQLPLFEIDIEKEALWDRITRRTDAMFQAGLLDEVAGLERRYGRAPHPMKAIGIKEVLDYFDGKLTYRAMREAITVHTRQLAKRQRTFNRTQFPPHPLLPKERLEAELDTLLKR
ncbi:MAG: tRNA (adenosine(37)-N6)-dimethylallyltransferase MiaA [Epsilonproteobacteria bacterium]|nr:tRNA (adenosine(37)-N6)-dimethylallyltransferase MiaA [Campylobacterota bacterium]